MLPYQITQFQGVRIFSLFVFVFAKSHYALSTSGRSNISSVCIMVLLLLKPLIKCAATWQPMITKRVIQHVFFMYQSKLPADKLCSCNTEVYVCYVIGQCNYFQQYLGPRKHHYEDCFRPLLRNMEGESSKMEG